jgi:hypothetical protein
MNSHLVPLKSPNAILFFVVFCAFLWQKKSVGITLFLG